MPDRCPQCDLNYYREPGFYYGAMFIAYCITAWVFFMIGAIMTFVFDIEFNIALITIIVVATVFFVYFFRLARSIWIHIFVRYDPSFRNADG